ncbi:MAG: oligosaccharide flippase family protein [Bacteroidales bacterium]|nr:oligosaccharide flippase family protein [Bacteroidales bacterium]
MTNSQSDKVSKPASLNKTLISGLFWVLLANLLVKPLWLLGIEVGVQNAVGTEMYGFYIGIFNLTYIFNILLDLGVTNYNTRNIAQYPHLISKHLSGILSIKLLLLALYVVVTFSVGALLGYDTQQFHLLALLSFNQFLSSMILYLRSNFEGLLMFKWDSLLSVMDRVLMIAICGVMLWGPTKGSMTIFKFAYAQTAAYLITATLALWVLVHKTKLRGLRWNKPFTLAILKKSLPFALLVLLMASYNRLDPVLLQLLSPDGAGDYNAGVYAGAFRLLDALTMIAYLVSVPLLPIFSKMTKKHEVNGELGETVRMMFSMMMVFAVTASCALASMDNDLMTLFYDSNEADYAAVFRIVIFCIIPISTTYVFGTLLTAAGKLKSLNIFALASLVINILVNILLIPSMGAKGSAFAALTAQMFMAVAQVVAAVKIFKLKPSIGYILKMMVFALIIVGCALCIPYLQWWLALSGVAIVAVGVAIALRLIDLKSLFRIIKNEK